MFLNLQNICVKITSTKIVIEKDGYFREFLSQEGGGHMNDMITL